MTHITGFDAQITGVLKIRSMSFKETSWQTDLLNNLSDQKAKLERIINTTLHHPPVHSTHVTVVAI